MSKSSSGSKIQAEEAGHIFQGSCRQGSLSSQMKKSAEIVVLLADDSQQSWEQSSSMYPPFHNAPCMSRVCLVMRVHAEDLRTAVRWNVVLYESLISAWKLILCGKLHPLMSFQWHGTHVEWTGCFSWSRQGHCRRMGNGMFISILVAGRFILVAPSPLTSHTCALQHQCGSSHVPRQLVSSRAIDHEWLWQHKFP